MRAAKIVHPLAATALALLGMAAGRPLFAADAPAAPAAPGAGAAGTAEPPLDKLDFRPIKKLPVKTDNGDAERAIANFKVAAGLKVKLWAAEPMLSNPNALTVDEKGVVYVSEANRFKGGVLDVRGTMSWLEEDIASKTVADRIAMLKRHATEKSGIEGLQATDAERIMRIEDTTGSGRADKYSVFAEGFNRPEDGLASGVFAYHGSVYATIIPNLYRMRDTTGAGKADEMKVLSTGYGVRYAYIGHDLHGMVMGPDGRLYFSIGDRAANALAVDGTTAVNTESGSVFRCDLDGSNLELFAIGLRNPQELRFDAHGNLFTGDNNPDKGDPARWVYVTEGSDNGWRIGYQHGEKPRDGGPWTAEQIFQTEASNNANYIVPPVAHAGAGPSGLAFYNGVGLPAQYENTFFMCDYRGAAATSGIWAFKVKPKGAGFELTSVDGKPIDRNTNINQASIFVGTGVVDVEHAPDGSLYVADWTQGWDRPFKGRVYRLVDESQDASKLVLETKKLIAEGMEKRPADELVTLLAHPDLRVRQEAQFALAKDPVNLSKLVKAAVTPGSPLARLHGIWGIGQLARKTPTAAAQVLPLLADADLEVRCQAAKVAGDAKAAGAYDALLKLAADPEPRARYFAAMALGKLGKKEAVPALFNVLKENADKDPVLRYGAVWALAKIGDEPSLVAAAGDASVSVRLGAALALRQMGNASVAKFLKDADRIVALEAARAINDASIDAALPELAALASAPVNANKGANEKTVKNGGPGPFGNPSDWLFWRVTNANYRLGTAEAAKNLATIAGRADLPSDIRVEALHGLAEWAKPGNRDRITNLFRPLAATPVRDPAVAREAAKGVVDALAKDKSRDVQVAAAKLAQKYGLGDPATLAATVKNGGAPDDVRLAALGTLVERKDPAVGGLLEALSADKADAVRRAAIRIRTTQPNGVASAAAVLAGAAPAGDKQAAIDGLGDAADPAADPILADWAKKLAAKQVPAELQLEVLEAAAKKKDPAIAAAVGQFNAARDPKDNIGEYREALAGGNAANGQKIFAENAAVSCMRCHMAGGTGGIVGPALDGIGARQTRDYLLESVVKPDAVFAPGFESVMIRTKAKKYRTGIVAREDDKEIVLRNPETNELTTVAKADVDTRERGPSVMPEGLHKALSKRELRDLVEWLASLKDMPKGSGLEHGSPKK
ncbi:MAG TPA: PVC-type heme-binding CxxCH protein [Humisphaera sp.]